MRVLILLLLPFISLAQLPSSGSLSLKSAAGAGRSISQEVDGNETGSKSLTTLSETASFTAPHSILEFRGYPTEAAPGAPATCSAAEDTPNTDIVATWTDPASGSVAYFETVLFVNGVQTGVYSSVGLAHSLILTNPTAGEAYKYRIRACNSGGDCGDYCETNEVTYVGITAPTTVTATLSGSSISVAWSGATGTITNYEIQRSVNGGAYAFFADDTSSPNSDATISSGNTYTYRVRAENSGGSSDWTVSNTIDYSIPGVVSNINTNIVASGIELGWDAPATGTATNYRVDVSEDGGPYQFYENTGISVTILVEDADLTEGLTYQFRIRAENGLGNSAYVEGSEVLY